MHDRLSRKEEEGERVSPLLDDFLRSPIAFHSLPPAFPRGMKKQRAVV